MTIRISKKAICRHLIAGLTGLLAVLGAPRLLGAPGSVTFTPTGKDVEVYDFAEVTVDVEKPDASNPFTDVTVSGTFGKVGASERYSVAGFCDSNDGSVFRIRFMPSSPGEHTYSLVYRQGSFETTQSGSFQALAGKRRGPIRVDPQYPWHFIWEGTGEHYFLNGTTAYFLMGWKEDRIIQYSIERLHRLKVNRMRVTIAGRAASFMGDAVKNDSEVFTANPTPWPAKKANDFYNPGFDYARFDVEYWRKWDRALRFARDHDMIISVVLDMGDNAVHPEAGSEDEYRFIRFAVARFSAFSNITWDLGDDLNRYRSDEWTHETGTLIKKWDASRHLATSHPTDNAHQDRTSDWFDFTSFQEWSRRQHTFMLGQRKEQEKTGRIIPQVNEEYGYEDHYPMWAPGPGSESADVLCRTAWDIYMAGGYQTAGETARRGTNVWPDTGGGWLNGRGDDTMTMFVSYGHIVDFFTSFEWWKTEPHDELVNNGRYCLAQPGEIYAVYLRCADSGAKGSNVTIQLESGTYEAHWFSALTGEIVPLPEVNGPAWTSPPPPDRADWALLLKKVR